MSKFHYRLQARAGLAAKLTTIEALISGGDDYEVLCTVPEGRLSAFVAAAKAQGVAVTRDRRDLREATAPPRFVARTGAR